MRTLVFLLVSLLLAGCGRMAAPAPSPTPRPTATPTLEPRYYPSAEKDVVVSLIRQIPKEWVSQTYQEIPSDNGVIKRFVIVAASTGRLEQIQIRDWQVDVVWVYQRGATVSLYPLVVGVQGKDEYVPYYVRYTGQPVRNKYLSYLEEHGILDRGRLLFPLVEGNFIDRRTDIDWEACGETLYCQLGKYMQETYRLDHDVVLGAVGTSPIPEGWVLGWTWDAATDENTLREYQKVDLP